MEKDKCWFCLQEVEKDKWREHMDVVHRAVNREMPVENNSIPLDERVMQKIADIIENKIKDTYMGQQASQNGGLTGEQENFEFIITDVIIKTLTSLKEEISNLSV